MLSSINDVGWGRILLMQCTTNNKKIHDEIVLLTKKVLLSKFIEQIQSISEKNNETACVCKKKISQI